jgi:hypothetical protein
VNFPTHGPQYFLYFLPDPQGEGSLATQRGHSIEEIARELLEVSAEAQERARLHDGAMRSLPREMQLPPQSVPGSGARGSRTPVAS